MTTPECPVVEVIVPFRDQGAWLRQACQSLLSQSLPHWRALLINDQSAPDSVEIAEQLCHHDRRFQLLHLNLPKTAPGPWLARNQGIAQATAPLVAFLDADDLWHPQKLERQLLLHPPGSRVLSVSGYHRFQADSLVVVETRQPPPQLNLQELFLGNAIPLSTVIVDRELLLPSGGFQPERHEDYGLWLRLFAAAQPPHYRCVPEALMAYRLHAHSLSAARHRSLLAVNDLFRQHLPQRRRRWPALLRWGLERSRQAAFMGLGSRATGQRSQLPEPFRTLLAEASEA